MGAWQADRPLLSCQGVTKHFGAMAAIRDVSFDLRPGDVLGIGGPNGAGKTTLFDVISGLQPASAGSIRLEGIEILGRRPWEICQRGIARTFQLNASFDTLTVRENVEVGAYYGHRDRLPGLRAGSETRARVDAAIELVGLGRLEDVEARQLPVLGRKLLMIASAVATSPKILLMDEPVGGLNPEEIGEVSNIIERLRGTGLTLIVIEHVMRFLVQLSTRMMILHHGEKIYEGSPQGLVRDPRVIEVYLGSGTSERLQRLLQRRSADGAAA